MEFQERLTDPGSPPDNQTLKAWLGETPYRYWKALADLIETNHPDVFAPEWLFGGRKHGWSLRYKKSRSFCTFVPEKERFLLVIVFGKTEREAFESIRAQISPPAQRAYDDAETYRDGKWVALAIQNQQMLQNACTMLHVKRKPKKH